MKRRNRIQNCILLLLLLALTLSGCGAAPQEDTPAPEQSGSSIGNPLAENTALDNVFSLNCMRSESMNPLSGTSVVNLQLSGLLYESLFTVKADYSYEPTRLISEYSTDDGGKTWVFTVNTQVQFSDGSYLSARDAAYSVRRAMQSKLYKARLDNYSVIYGVSALDNEKFMLTLYQENLLFPALLTIPILKDGDYNTRCPVGTGLYKMDGAEIWNGFTDAQKAEAEESGEALVMPAEPKLTLNSLHPDAQRAPLQEIHLREYADIEDIISAFEDGLLDLVENDPTGVASAGFGSANEVRSYTSPSMYYLGFNVKSPFVMTAQYRYALSYLIDRDSIVKKLMGRDGTAAVCPIIPTSPLYDKSIEDVIRYAPQTALNALERGNCADHDDDGKLEYMVTGIPMEINLNFIVNTENSTKVLIAQRIVEDLAAVGITATLRELNWNDYIKALEEGEFDMYFGEVMLSSDFNLSALLTKDGSLNYGGVEDEGYAARIAAYLAADDTKRPAACSDMCQYIVANAPIIPIAFESREILSHRGVISGIELSPYNMFYNIADWTIRLD